MSETIRHDQEFDPSQLVGGVAHLDEFVAVSPSEPYIDPNYPFRLDELVNSSGSVVGLVTTISPGGSTPAWEILRMPETFGYIEVSQIIAGSGRLALKGAVDDCTRSGWYPNDRGQMQFDSRAAINDVPVGQDFHVRPGETFQLMAGGLGLRIITTFPAKPFQLSFERRVASLM